MEFYSSNILNQRVMIETPFDQIKKSLSNDVPLGLISKIPDKWKKTGEVLIIRLATDLNKYRQQMGEKYAKVLRCKTVLNDIGGISGTYRKPKVEVIYGSNNTETVHKENGIRYKLDPQKIMFSSGNMDERIRMANISNENETVVDLFAGIGYFALPIAVYCKPRKIFACEINPIAYDYLRQNIVLNDVTSAIEPLLGDNRTTAPKNIADRVIMGYIDDAHRFLPVAINCLRNNNGIIHYHDVCPNDSLPDRPLKKAEKVAMKYNRVVQVLKYRKIKSYAPNVSHVVFDMEIGER